MCDDVLMFDRKKVFKKQGGVVKWFTAAVPELFKTHCCGAHALLLLVHALTALTAVGLAFACISYHGNLLSRTTTYFAQACSSWWGNQAGLLLLWVPCHG